MMARLRIAGLCLALLTASAAGAQDTGERLTLALKDIDIAEVMEMLSRKARVNILVASGVTGDVSFNLFDVTVAQAIRHIAEAAGFAVEVRDESYFIVQREDVGKYAVGGATELRTYKVEYSDPAVVENILKNHLSALGKITTMIERKLLVVEDQPKFLQRIESLLRRVDVQPRQILIEAKIVEIALRENESFGMNWSRLFRHEDASGSVGTRGFADTSASGLFFEVVTPHLNLFLNTLQGEGRLRTLSTPKLLALENQEAKAIIGDRLGFKVTTTIDQVTTESIEFLESGVILKVTPSVDREGHVLLDIHPEVSTGTVSDDGIPSLTTTEVTTRMLVRDGETIFIGGLIKRSVNDTEERVPLLGHLPLIGRAFSNTATNVINTETIVLITPYVLGTGSNALMELSKRRALETESAIPSLDESPGADQTEPSAPYRVPPAPSASAPSSPAWFSPVDDVRTEERR